MFTRSARDSTQWITDGAWLTGTVGAMLVVVSAWAFAHYGFTEEPIPLYAELTLVNRNHKALLVLGLCSLLMLVFEALRVFCYNKKNYFSLSPLLVQGRYFRFFLECLAHYLVYMALMVCVIVFFKTSSEYGYSNAAAFYQAWFDFLQVLQYLVIYLGLPYILLTRGLKHSKKRDANSLVAIGLHWRRLVRQTLNKKIPHAKNAEKKHTKKIKTSLLALLVKVFFLPLMSVFFAEQFFYLAENIDYLLYGLPNLLDQGAYSHQKFNIDVFNIAISLIFSIDVAIAWCGYLSASRWVDNHVRSVDPSVLGWAVCLMCYPPFQSLVGVYYAPPNDSSLLYLPNPWVVSVLTVMMVSSYAIYMCSTIAFGVRFSNLTHRGIIRSGVFAYVRHPAYAAKNLSWWLVMFPVVMYTAVQGNVLTAFAQCIGLLLMTWIYILRALTEEKHLLADKAYRHYCHRVKYRFFPGII